MKKTFACAALAFTLTACAHTGGGTSREAWQVMRASDPVTRVSTCAVVASDYIGNTRFTQSGALYPVVENNSTHGVLVGVSSGGRFRVPTGDIL